MKAADLGPVRLRLLARGSLEAHGELRTGGVAQRLDEAAHDDFRAGKAHGADLGEEADGRKPMLQKTTPQVLLERIESGRPRRSVEGSRGLLAHDAAHGVAAMAAERGDLAQRTAFSK